MTEAHRLAEMMDIVDERIANPKEILVELRVQVSQGVKPSMREDMPVGYYVPFGIQQKTQVLGGDPITSFLGIGERGNPVALEERLSAVEQVRGPPAFESEESKQHVLMVAAQEYGTWLKLLESQKAIENGLRPEPAIDIIPDENDLILVVDIAGVAQVLEQELQFIRATMNIPYGIKPARVFRDLEVLGHTALVADLQHR